MDAALLLIAGNEPCPQPQTSEHLAAVEIMKLNHMIILQNKIDLVKEAAALQQQGHAECPICLVDMGAGDAVVGRPCAGGHPAPRTGARRGRGRRVLRAQARLHRGLQARLLGAHAVRRRPAARARTPEGNLGEVGYDPPAPDPIGTLASVYERLGWHDFGALRPRLEKQLAGHRAYQPNAHSTLPPDLEAPRGAAPPRHLLPHHHHRPHGLSCRAHAASGARRRAVARLRERVGVPLRRGVRGRAS